VFYVYILVKPLRTKRNILFKDQPSSYGLGWLDLASVTGNDPEFWLCAYSS